MSAERIVAEYFLADFHGDASRKAEGIAIGLTVGSWTDLPAARQEAMKPRRGEVVSISREEGGVRVRISYPIENVTSSVPAILTTVFGKLSMDGKVRLECLHLPGSFARHFPGPRYGIEGLRKKLNVYDRPLLMSIFKSCLGYDAEQLADLFREQALGGVDLVKDDEIFFDESSSGFARRIKACREAARVAREETGKHTLYAVNLTGSITELRDKALRGVEAGAECFLVNVLPYGYDLLHRLAEDEKLDVAFMAHPAMAGALYASTDYGISARVVLGTLMRLCGADIGLYPSPYGSVALEREAAMSIAHELRDAPSVHRRTWPVPSAGIHPGLVPQLYGDLGDDQIINAGGGIHGHPAGSRAGAQAFVAAIRAVVAGTSLAQAAQDAPELATALKVWGGSA